MAYPSRYNSGFCPDSHPKRFVSIFYEVLWSVDAFKDMWYGDSQPFVFSTGDDTGYGYHGDFVNGWDVPTLQKAVNECTADSGVIEDCPVFDFFTTDFSNGCKVFSSIDEQTSGTLDALPGCNPVTSGPELAVAQSGCGAPTTFGTPEYNYVDFTVSKGFEYIGCGFDFAGQVRTLTGASTNSDSMTNSQCIDFCVSKGYSIAGTEYSRECYCGDSIAADREPITGLVGACNMKCTGDATETCGGGARMSLYKKCDGDSCQNIIYNVNNGTIASGSNAINSTTPVIVSAIKSIATGTAILSSVQPTLSAGPYSNHSTSATAVVIVSATSLPIKVASASNVAAIETAATATDLPVIIIQTVTVVPIYATSSASAAAINEPSKCGATYTVTVAQMTVTVTSFASASTPTPKSPVKVASTPIFESSSVKVASVTAIASSSSTPAKPFPTLSSAPYGFQNGTASINVATAGGDRSSRIHAHTHAHRPSAGVHMH